ncbi:hypothetical protein EBZ35_03205 [bacterium]|nr:hypothetical protein [bacterium]
MNITAGLCKGFPLRRPRSPHCRPTQDKVRQAVFNILGPMTELVFGDLFSGSGAMGLEAYSRGARRVYLVDRHTQDVAANHAMIAQRLASRQLDTAFCQRVTIHTGDATRWLPKLGSMDVIYLDPPWTDLTYFERMMTQIRQHHCLSPHGRLVVEHPVRFGLPLGHHWQIHSTHYYGNTQISVITP